MPRPSSFYSIFLGTGLLSSSAGSLYYGGKLMVDAGSSGTFYPSNNPSGFITQGALTNTGNYLVGLINSISGGGATGDFYPNSNPSGYINQATLADTGNFLQAQIAAQSGLLTSLTGATGSYYPRSNPSGYTTSGVSSSSSSASAITATFTNSGSISGAIGEVFYISSNNALKKARADAAGTTRAMAMATSAMASGTTGSFALYGIVPNLSGIVANAVYYLSAATSGSITSVAPTGSGQYVVELGLGISTTDFLFNPKSPILL